MKGRWLVWLMCGALLCALAGCRARREDPAGGETAAAHGQGAAGQEQGSSAGQGQGSSAGQGQGISADGQEETAWSCGWCVYWDADVAEELSALGEDLGNVSMFACYFDDSGDVYIPEALTELCGDIEEIGAFPTYLSFTNDVQHGDGSATQKDPGLLRRLWKDEAQMAATAERMLRTVRSLGAQGIEVDFENIKKQELWERYARFLNVLWAKADETQTPMRVVLSVNAPVETVTFPEGPTYSVMCYNLYGTHSGPGPKADTDFLKETAAKFSAVPGIRYALATGGFEWDAKETVTRSLTQTEALILQAENGSTPTRDGASQALWFDYAADGARFCVWYADAATLTAWRRAILEVDAGAEFDLWRIGGNQWK